MRLSEAIRIGAMLAPQMRGSWEGFVSFPSVPGDVLGLRAVRGTCALQGAYDALGQVETPEAWKVVISAHCGDILTLNDEFGWTREQIADQVALWEVELGVDESPRIVKPDAVNA